MCEGYTRLDYFQLNPCTEPVTTQVIPYNIFIWKYKKLCWERFIHIFFNIMHMKVMRESEKRDENDNINIILVRSYVLMLRLLKWREYVY